MKKMIAVVAGVLLFLAGKSMGQSAPKKIVVSLQDATVDCSHKNAASQKPCKFHKVTLVLNPDHTVIWE